MAEPGTGRGDRAGGGGHLQEAAGTLLTALIWGVGILAGFMVLGMLTHALVSFTVGSSKTGWRVAAGAVVASLFLAAVVILLIVIVRSAAALPAHHREHVEYRRRQEELRAQRQQEAQPDPTTPS